MAKDAAADAVADQVLGSNATSGGTLIGATVGSGIGEKMDKVAPSAGRGMFKKGMGTVGKVGDSSFGRAFKTMGGNVAREGVKGGVKGGLAAQMSSAFGGRRKRSTEEGPDVPLLGFGPCPPPTWEEIGSHSEGVEQAAFTYLAFLRVQCLPSKMDDVHEILSKGYLQFDEQRLYFTVPEGLDVL